MYFISTNNCVMWSRSRRRVIKRPTETSDNFIVQMVARQDCVCCIVMKINGGPIVVDDLLINSIR